MREDPPAPSDGDGEEGGAEPRRAETASEGPAVCWSAEDGRSPRERVRAYQRELAESLRTEFGSIPKAVRALRSRGIEVGQKTLYDWLKR